MTQKEASELGIEKYRKDYRLRQATLFIPGNTTEGSL